MATVQANEGWLANHAMTVHDHDPGTTDATAFTTWLDMRDFSSAVVTVMPTAITGGVTAVAIQAAEDATGTNATTIKTIATGVDADALGDFICGEITAEQIAAAGAAAGYSLRYVSPLITCSNAGDEALVQVIRVADRAYSGLTAATSIA